MNTSKIDKTYDRPWMEKRSGPEASQRRWAETMVETIVRDLSPGSVLDVGCGSCNFANKFAQLDCAVAAIDGSSHAGDFVGNDVDFLHYDLTKPLNLKMKFDVVLCVEVIEHIEAEYEDVILQTITNHADCWIVFTGAKPDQGGIGHVNCRPKEYWLEKFAALGFKAVSSSAWENEWREKKVRWWYVDNLIVLRPTDAYELNIVPQEKGER